MARTKFFVVVFICFLSYAEANNDCVSYDVKQAGVCGGTKDLCITIDGETTPVTAYSYSKEMKVTVVCHYKEVIEKKVKDFRLSWKKGEKDISNDKNCRNLKSVISLSAATNNTVYTCERHYTKIIDDMTANITFLYTIEDKAPLTVTVENENGTSPKWEVAHESYYNVNEGSYYYFDGEVVNVKCGLKNSYRNANFLLRLTSLNSKNEKNILHEKCSRGNDTDRRMVEYKQELNAAMTGLHYTCALLIGEKSTTKCVDEKQKYIFTLKFKLAKLRIYIDGRIREEEETVSGPEVVYKYEENVTIAAKCSYDDKVYTSRGLNMTSHRPIWNNTEKFYSTFPDDESISSPNQNLVQIKLFLKHNNSYIDCVEEDSRIRLRFIYDKENLNERLKSFFESYWIFLTAGLVLIVVTLAVICLALKSKKNPKEDKRRLNPKGSRDNLDDNLQTNPADQNITRSEPKLNEFYTELHADTTSDEYCSPYVAMYAQAVPKSVRSPTVKPKPQPSPRNIENYSNIRGRVYDEPSTYNNIAKNTGTMYHNVAKNTGTQYHNVAKNTGTQYHNVAKNTGTMYHNVAKNTGATYNNINKTTKVAEKVNFHDNTAASYYNTENGIHSSDVDSDTEFYEVPY